MTHNRYVSDSPTSAATDAAQQQRTSSAAMVERMALIIFGVLRLGILVQLTTGVIIDCANGTITRSSLVMCVVVIVWAVVFFTTAARRGSFAALPIWWGLTDVALAALAMIVVTTSLPTSVRIGTWSPWGYGYTCSVIPLIPTWLKSRVGTMACTIGLGAIYAATVLPGNTHLLPTVVFNSLSFLVFTIACLIIVPSTRGLARDFDGNAERALHLAGEVERARYQFHVHNATGLLAQLARDDTPPEVLPSLRAQALAESERLRHEVLDPSGTRTDDQQPSSLEQVVQEGVAGFGNLPLDVRTASGRGVQVRPLDATVLRSALNTLLYNVQFHAHASEVVVQAERTDDAWQVSVRDDGVGFDPARTAFGFGLQSQVLDPARRAGMSVQIDSRPGQGTCVRIRGAITESRKLIIST